MVKISHYWQGNISFIYVCAGDPRGLWYKSTHRGHTVCMKLVCVGRPVSFLHCRSFHGWRQGCHSHGSSTIVWASAITLRESEQSVQPYQTAPRRPKLTSQCQHGPPGTRTSNQISESSSCDHNNGSHDLNKKSSIDNGERLPSPFWRWVERETEKCKQKTQI